MWALRLALKAPQHTDEISRAHSGGSTNVPWWQHLSPAAAATSSLPTPLPNEMVALVQHGAPSTLLVSLACCTAHCWTTPMLPCIYPQLFSKLIWLIPLRKTPYYHATWNMLTQLHAKTGYIMKTTTLEMGNLLLSWCSTCSWPLSIKSSVSCSMFIEELCQMNRSLSPEQAQKSPVLESGLCNCQLPFKIIFLPAECQENNCCTGNIQGSHCLGCQHPAQMSQ